MTAHSCRLSLSQLHAIDRILSAATSKKRSQLFEHEVYALLAAAGSITPPRHLFIPVDSAITAASLADFRSDKLVLKIVSPEIVHKSDAGAVVFVPNDPAIAAQRAAELLARAKSISDKIEGLLIVEFVDHEAGTFGSELFVGIRATREFGPVIAAGLGGMDTEYLAAKLRPGMAVAKALVSETDPAQFFEYFRQTAAYDLLAGRVRGHARLVSDEELLRCFQTFITIARTLCQHSPDAGPRLVELEVNPFAFRNQSMIPLDGRGRLGTLIAPSRPRPLSKVSAMLEPRTIAVLGVSKTRRNFGRIILENIKASGFPVENLYAVRPDADTIDGVKCFPDLASAPTHIDLLVMACAADAVPKSITEAIECGEVSSAVIIPGGLGETAATVDLQKQMQQCIQSSRDRRDCGPVFLGGNCMGLRSRPGLLDTFFVQDDKLAAQSTSHQAPARRVALISQSGAFLVSRLSNLEFLDPALSISVGNQIDLTLADLLRVVQDRDDIDVIGVYAEGFKDLDGLDFIRAVEAAAAKDKVVIFYKAGRTPAGRSATAGHTASVAGDYDVCQAVATQAGAIVTDTFKEFEQLLEIAACLHEKEVTGRRIAAISNAGFEAVGMADTILGPRYQINIAKLSPASIDALRRMTEQRRLSALVNVGNPIDLTPMASDAAYADCVRIMLDDQQVDAAVVSVVPETPELLTGPQEIHKPESLARQLPDILAHQEKPLIAVVDSGLLFEPFVHALRAGGVPVIRSCDQAIRSLGRYLCHRTRARVENTRETATSNENVLISIA